MSADRLSSSERSRMMGRIRSRHTKPERSVRHALFVAGFRYRLHRRGLPGSPDIVMPSRQVAIFVHGCFWHLHRSCRLSALPVSNAEFWKAKLNANRRRDRRTALALAKLGWRVLVVWECFTRKKSFESEFPALFKSWLASTKGREELSGHVR